LSYKEVFAGFADDATLMTGGMCALGLAVFETGAAKVIGNTLMKFSGSSERVFLSAVVIIVSCMSAFFSNTATSAMFITIAGAVAAGSNGKITKKNTFMPIGIAAVCGGMITVIGSPPQIVAQGMLKQMGLPQMEMFTLAVGGIPLVITAIIWYTTIGYKMQQKFFDFEEVIVDDAKNVAAERQEKEVTYKTWIPIVILVLCIAAFVKGLWTMGIITVLAGILCVVTGCISQKRLLQQMDWVTILVMAGTLGFAAGMQKSGAGKVIANFSVSMLGSDASPWLVFSIIVLVAAILTNLMSNTAVAAMLIPIGVAIAQEMALNPLTIVLGILFGANLSFATPLATPAVTEASAMVQ
jgi:anion transporter